MQLFVLRQFQGQLAGVEKHLQGAESRLKQAEEDKEDGTVPMVSYSPPNAFSLNRSLLNFRSMEELTAMVGKISEELAQLQQALADKQLPCWHWIS